MADGRIIIDTQIDNSGASKGIQGLSSKIGGMASKALGMAAKTSAAIAGVATGAVVALTKASIKQYAEYEQLTGGVETLFKNSSNKVMEYANNAYKTAGMSANEYMNTITGFAASLLQGLGGDTKKAADIGNMAVSDMSDNANKMGTAIENIQNAYQGFAKQNYTMLDNLKLGYGGTKTEMQRLLKDATKLTGIKYNINNFSDVISAIHVIQNQMGVTGTTAKEAASTIEGSLNMTKSAWTNLLTGMADDKANFGALIDELVNSLGALGENLMPRIQIALTGIGKLIDALLPQIANKIPEIINSILPNLVNSGINIVTSLMNGISNNLPQIANSSMQIITTLITGFTNVLPQVITIGVSLIQTLISGLMSNMPLIINSAMQIVNSLINSFIPLLPQILQLGLQLLISLAQGIAQSIPSLIPTIVNLIISLADMIIQNLPTIISTAIQIIMAIVQGLITALPTLVQEVPRIINSFSDAIYSQLPLILKAGIDILLMIIKGLINTIPTLVANLPQIIMAIVNVITLFNWASLGKGLVTKIGEGIKGMVGSISSTARGMGTSVAEGIKGVFTQGGSIGSNFINLIRNGAASLGSSVVSTVSGIGSSAISAIKNVLSNPGSIGSNLIKGIWNGISNMSGWILSKIGGFAGSVINSIKEKFGIHSPSRVMRDLIGVNLVKGIGVGFDVETPNLESDIQDNMSNLVAKMKGTVDLETAKTTARVVAYNNSLGGTDTTDTIDTSNKIENHIHLEVEGRELAYAVAPHQDVLNDYYKGR